MFLKKNEKIGYLLAFSVLVCIIQFMSVSLAGIYERQVWIGNALNGLDMEWRDWNLYQVLLWLLPQLSAFLLYVIAMEEQMGNPYQVMIRTKGWTSWWSCLQKNVLTYGLGFTGIVAFAAAVSLKFQGTNATDGYIVALADLLFPSVFYFFIQLLFFLEIYLFLKVCFKLQKLAILCVSLIEIVGMYSGTRVGKMQCLMLGSNGMWNRYEATNSSFMEKCIGMGILLGGYWGLCLLMKVYVKKNIEV